MWAPRRNSSDGSNLRCSWRTESMLVPEAGMVALSAIRGPWYEVSCRIAFYCVGLGIVCRRRYSRSLFEVKELRPVFRTRQRTGLIPAEKSITILRYQSVTPVTKTSWQEFQQLRQQAR